MEDSDDFNYSRLNRAIVEHMNWFFHFRLRSIDARMTQMKTAEPGRELISRLGERVFGIGCDCSDRCSKEEGVAASTVGSPSLSAGGQKVRKIALCRLRDTKTRHWDQRVRFLEVTSSPSR